MAVEVVTKNVSGSYYSNVGTITRDFIPEENLEILENFPEVERSMRFLQTCWLYKDYHTPAFRKTSSRIINCLIKAFSHFEKEIYGVYQSSDPNAALLKRSVTAQIFWGSMMKYLRKYSMLMAVSANSAKMQEGEIGSYALKISEESFSAVEIIEKWDQIGNIVSFSNDFPPASIHVLSLRILDGIEIFRVGSKT